ncbi:MAG: hypothetical protein ACMVO3_22630 [Thalassobaculum sp.]
MTEYVTDYGTWDLPAAWDGENGFGWREIDTVDGTSIARLLAPAYATLLMTRDVRASTGSSLSATSTTSATIGTGAQTLTIETGKGFAAGNVILASEDGTPANFMLGTVTSYNTDTGALAFTVASGDTGGSGTIADWNVTISGPRGAAGVDGDVTGPVSSTDNAWVRFNGTGGGTIQNGLWTEADSGAVTAGGDLFMNDKAFTRATVNHIQAVSSQVSASVTSEVEISGGYGQALRYTLDADGAVDFQPPATDRVYSVRILLIQDGTGSRTFTLKFNNATTAMFEDNGSTVAAVSTDFSADGANVVREIGVDVYSDRAIAKVGSPYTP